MYKKHIKGLLMVAALLLCIAVPSLRPQASTRTVTQDGVEFTLTTYGDYDAANDKEILQQLLKSGVADVSEYGISADDRWDFADAFVDRNPGIGNLGVLTCTYDGDYMATIEYLDPDYDAYYEWKTKVDAIVKSEVDPLVDRENMSDMEVALSVSNYITTNVTYEKGISEDVYDVLTTKETDCGGYSNLFYYLCRHYGLNVGITHIDDIVHASNVIELDGKWYFVDCVGTGYPKSNIVSLSMFLLGTAQYLDEWNNEFDDVEILGIDDPEAFSAPDACYDYNFFNNTEDGHPTSFYYYNGIWYYCGWGDSDDEQRPLVKRDMATGEEEEIALPELDGDFSRPMIIGFEDKIYMNLAKSVIEYDIAAGTWRTVGYVDEDGGDIYELSISDGSLYAETTTLNTMVDYFNRTLVEIPGITVSHTWEETVTEEPACFSYGTTVRTCSVCGKEETVATDPTYNLTECTLTLTGDTTFEYDGTEKIPEFTLTYGGEDVSDSVYRVTADGADSFGDATLTVSGVYPYHGSLSASYTVTHTDHACKIADKNVSATCETDGYWAYECTVPGCDYSYTEPIEKLGHKLGDAKTVQEVTCEEDGISRVSCTRSGCDYYEDTVIPATGHTYNNGAITTRATCTKDGVRTYTCKTCGGTKTEVIPATKEVNYVTVTLDCDTFEYDGTAKEPGVTLADGDTAIDPQYYTVEYDNNIEPGFADVYITGTGGYSGSISAIFEIVHTEHTWDGGTAEGNEVTYTCTVCGTAKTEEFSDGDHTWGDGTVTKEATCTEAGTVSYPCTDDGCTVTKVEAVPATGHTWDSGVVTRAATCTETGVRTFTCGTCGGTKTWEVPATGHKWDGGVVTEAATCTEDGTMTYTCKTCGLTKTETIPATGHETETTGAYAAACTEAGYTGDTYCTACHALVQAGEEIPATGHTWDGGTVTEAATCTEPGTMTYTCTACGGTKTETIPATGHTWDGGVVTEAPACVHNGTRTYTCTVCGGVKTEDIANTGLHSFGAGVVIQEPTCTDAGIRAYTCTVCGYVETEAIPAKGHSNLAVNGAVAAQGGKDGYTGDTYCTDCGMLVSRGSVIPSGEPAEVTGGGAAYTITGGTAEVTGVAEKTVKSVTVAATVTYNGVTYKVTGIAANAFRNCKKLTKVTIGKNVTKIGKKAFYGCKNLKKVVVKSKKLKSVGSKAFTGINRKAVFRVPAKKLKAYRKLLKAKTGFKKTMKVKK